MIDHRNTIIVIPARMASTRLPGKPMADIWGEPMIVHVWRRAIEAKVGHVMVAAAEDAICEAIRAEGGDAMATDPNLPSGSDRVAQALKYRDPRRKFEFVVNLQGDLPTIEPLAIQRCLAGLVNDTVDISTIAAPITERQEVFDPNVVKVIAPLYVEREIAFARDFVRELGPRHEPPYWHHIGIYAYRRAALERFVALPISAHEEKRRLEQMRALDAGMKIAVVKVDTVPLGVDTPAQLETARDLLRPA
jgi:3-deoxy-manno-octulosonate cytidylyltransferase (CMP-KDO synthetase)